MNITMFIQIILIFQFPFISATTYGASCASNSDCDKLQNCVDRICRCNPDERRFWTGYSCPICAKGYILTKDRCYQAFNDLKTWPAARNYCRAQYADLFTWRNNEDEQILQPYSQGFSNPIIMTLSLYPLPGFSYTAWSGATVTSLEPHTVKWVDPDGMKLNSSMKQWCNPTQTIGYLSGKQPSKESRKTPDGTETEECVTYIFGANKKNFFCLADDYCSQKYGFICEMNDASMKLATATHHGGDGDTSSGTGGGDTIDFNNPPPPPPTIDFESEKSPSALKEKTGALSTNLIIIVAVGIFLIVGAIAGYMVIQKKKHTSQGTNRGHGSVANGRPSVASSVGSMVDE